ncbi:hypothetical protein EYZ11_003750 [Aspergillus tanneri]|uniref:C2H2-type domain-containing protein n=1 Tax=Aspergillus tanneri TaxID=1220188 RepID=A0A4S3JMQ7_9EURO|nr:hypothetical protein EYZ11_003750 [Aspergillus tanneri]
MSSFLPVNTISSPPDRMMEDATTPTTPRAPEAQNPSRPIEATKGESTPRSVSNSNDPASRLSDSHSLPSASDDPAHADSDGDREGSDHDSDHKGNAPPSKKKKGQRFYCTDYPPCNLSFTRSEHLARHIRKHTGERPFQCHCSRRFSRLDNLRQHAQTVHVNEEIPGDSLAATGTRFQRQIRTDRVRPPGRARAGTGGSQGTHSRGHSRNLSASSIASTASTYSQPQEFRRRPPPLIMANDGRARLALDTMADPPSTPPGQVRGIPGQATAGSPYTSSHIFAAGGNGSVTASPMSSASHGSGFWEGKTAARRLSVPTGGNPFASHPVHAYPHGYPGAAGTTPYHPPGGVFASPVSSNYSLPRDEAAHSAADADLRRRTWHPSTYSTVHRPATSGLNSYQTPESVNASFGSGTSGEQPTRLPGIESFDKVVSQRPLTPPVRRSSPMQVDQPGKPSSHYNFGGGFSYNQPSVRPPPPISGPGHRRGHVSWDMSLHTNLTGLHIRDKPAQKDASHWSQQTIAELHNVGSRPSSSYQQNFQEYRAHGSHHPSHSNATSSSQATRTSPEDSSSSEGVHTPSTASLEYHPAIVHNSGYIEAHHTPFSSDTSQAVRTRYPQTR